MKRLLEVKQVPKVVIQTVPFGHPLKPVPANEMWFVVEDAGGNRYGEFDLESDAIAERDRLNLERSGY